jgi:NAD(P)-dependent dehydrogenase (short-subunit alcohol dehydrogenase family)
VTLAHSAGDEQPASARGRLAGRTSVIVGSGGTIGDAIAARFLVEGARVVGIDRRAVDAPFPVIEADLSNEAEGRAAFARIGSEYGPIHVVYVNAGTVDRADTTLLDTPLEVWQRAFDAIVTPVVLCCRYAVPQMSAKEGGSIILTGSFLAGIGAATAQMAFSAAKAAVTQIGRDLGIHLARRGIRVNTLALGPIETPELRQMFDRIGPEQVQRRMIRVPLGRPATLDELAASAVYLASDESGYMTGSVLPVDGGIPRAYTIPDYPSGGQ